MLKFQNKTVLVTGSGTGIGQAITKKFVENGASAIILGRRKEPLEETAKMLEEIIKEKQSNATIKIFGGVDVSNEKDVTSMFDASMEWYLDIGLETLLLLEGRKALPFRVVASVTGDHNAVSSELITRVRKLSAAYSSERLSVGPVKIGLDGDQLKETLHEYDGAICRSGVKITSESLEGNRRMKAIVRAGVGTDNIDGTELARQGIVVMNTPTGNTVSTAEHAFTLILALSRHVSAAHKNLTEGRWDRNTYMGVQLAGKTLGVVGLGRIGQEVAARAKAFQMKVIGHDPFISAEQASKLGIEYVDNVPDMLSRLDYMTVHTPLTSATRHMISKKELDLMKKGAGICVFSRAGTVDYKALRTKLQRGDLHAVLDVFNPEPLPKSSPLWKTPNLVITPHCSSDDWDLYTPRTLDLLFENMSRFLRGRKLKNIVDPVLQY